MTSPWWGCWESLRLSCSESSSAHCALAEFNVWLGLSLWGWNVWVLTSEGNSETFPPFRVNPDAIYRWKFIFHPRQNSRTLQNPSSGLDFQTRATRLRNLIQNMKLSWDGNFQLNYLSFERVNRGESFRVNQCKVWGWNQIKFELTSFISLTQVTETIQ